MRVDSTVSIYGLDDPITHEIRYVGMTSKPLDARLKRHLYERGKRHRCHWIQQLRKKGQIPGIFEIERVNGVNWEDAEKFWISYFKFIGANLTNGTSGGIGFRDGKHKSHSRKLIRQALSKRIISDETREKLKIAYHSRGGIPIEAIRQAGIRRRGIKKGPRSDSTKQKIRNALLGHSVSLETRGKIRLSLQGRVLFPLSSEIKGKISKTLQGHLVSQETRKKISDGHKGKILSDETKAKMSKSQLLRRVKIREEKKRIKK